MTRIGPHIDPPLAAIPAILEANDYSVFQTVLRDPHRLSKQGLPDEADCQAFHDAIANVPDWFAMAHASLITNLASPDTRIRHGSAGALVSDANLAASLGFGGVCFHVGYQKGHDTREAALDAVAYRLRDILPKLETGARILLENGCEGTELGQTVEEIGKVIRDGGANPFQVGVVLDTCHLHVAGFDLAAPEAPDILADEIEAAGLTRYLTALHLNDAREVCGSKRDRHAPPGQGTIGEGLRRLIRHPIFADLPAILEISFADVAASAEFLSSP